MSMIRPECGVHGWTLLIFLALLGCSSEPPISTAHVADSAGVAVITSHSPAWGDSVTWSLSPEPSLRIGSDAGDLRYELFRVRAVRRLPDGRILVANSGTDELRLYGSDGSWIRNIGRDGKGPGEFAQIMVMEVGADSIFVWDIAQMRVSVFDDTGAYVRSIPLNRSRTRLAGRFEDGTLLLEEYVDYWGDEPEAGVQPVLVRYQLADANGSVLSDLGEFERSVTLVRVREVDGEPEALSMGFPFKRRSYFATLSDGFLHGTGEHFEVREYGTSGELRRVVRLDSVPETVGPDDLEAYLDASAAWYDDSELQVEMERRLYAEVPGPVTKPTYTDLIVGAREDLWLKQFSLPGEAPRWTVFDSSGVHLGTMALPVGFELHQVGEDFVLGIRTNDLDLEIVELYALDRGTG